MKTISAGVYARISSDEDDTRLGVTRQVKDCEAEAERRGWHVAERYIDNDVSATRSKVRPEYKRMLAAVADGQLAALVVWDVDRLTRSPRELEDVIDLADRHGLQLASVGGEIDLATPQGRLTARLKGSVARHEAEQMSRRIRRKFDERAEAGAPHGSAAYGYRRIIETNEHGKRMGSRDEIDPEQASVIREAARRMLAGESMRAVAADFNARKVPPPRKGAWSSTTLRQIMTRDRNAALRRHRGQVVGSGAWEPIFDRGTHGRILALVADPERRTNKGSTRRHLLTGIARCGREGCDGTMVVNCGRMTAGGKRQPPAYVCKTCHRVRRKQADVETVVEGVVIARLKKPDAIAALALGDPAEVERARAEAAELEARLELAADEYADGMITGAQLRRITERLRPKIDSARATANRAGPSDVVANLAGPDAEARWHTAPLDTKRALLTMLLNVTIVPTGPGKSFAPESVRIDWKG